MKQWRNPLISLDTSLQIELKSNLFPLEDSMRQHESEVKEHGEVVSASRNGANYWEEPSFAPPFLSQNGGQWAGDQVTEVMME